MAPNNSSNTVENWIASLARQSASAEMSPKQRGHNSNDHNCGNGDSGRSNGGALTKIQRMERRDQKRIQREDRKRLAEVARQQRLVKKRRKLNADCVKGIPAPTPSVKGKTTGREERTVKRRMTTQSKQALARLSTNLESTLSSCVQKSIAASTNPRQSKCKYHTTRSQPQQTIVNGVPAEPNGKATKSSTFRPESKELQPRMRDYNGQGLVRPSLFIPFNDPSFKPKVEMEFEEHIPGFFGKAKQKAAKKQSDQNMLWKKCLQAKLDEDEKSGVGAEKTKRRRVDTRVEELMRRGVIV